MKRKSILAYVLLFIIAISASPITVAFDKNGFVKVRTKTKEDLERWKNADQWGFMMDARELLNLRRENGLELRLDSEDLELLKKKYGL
jgi:hypothetical protein